MKIYQHTWFKWGLISCGIGVFAVILLSLLNYYEVLEFVSYGQQTVWGIIFLILTWIFMIPVVIVILEQLAGIGLALGILAILLGSILNLVYYFGFGAVLGWLLGRDEYL